MKKIIFSLALLCGQSLTVLAQDVPIKATIKGADATELGLYVKPMNIEKQVSPIQLVVDGDVVEGTVSQAEEGFYSFYGRRNGGQLILPFYITDSKKLKKIKLVFNEKESIVDVDNNNRALSAFNTLLMERFNYYFANEKTMSKDERVKYIEHYNFAADSIAKEYKVDEKVGEYLKLWAFTMTKNVFGRVPQGVVKELDTPMALYFPSSAPHIVVAALPNGTMNEKLDYLNANYTCEPLKKRVVRQVLENFIDNFVSTSATFPQGIEDVTAVVEKYGLDTKYIETFKTRKAPVKGKPFPTTAKLQDANGNTMSFEQFRGTYVYVDLWASWCVPCCREVPYLQQLEKDLHGSPITFLSISLDSKEDSWKKKMTDLNMSGNQWISKDNTLAQTFDVRGIPRFLLFDKEGNVIEAEATRPSDPQTKILLQSLK